MNKARYKIKGYFRYIILRSFLFSLFLLGALSSTIPNQIPVAKAQTPEWSEPIVISPPIDENVGYSWFPEVVTDLTGQAHIFWVNWRRVKDSVYGGYDLVLYCQIRNERCTKPTEVIAYDWGGGINATRPAAAVDQYNNIHLLSRGIAPQGGVTLIYYNKVQASKAEMPSNWSPTQILSGGNTNSYYSDIAIDSKGVIHVVWNQRTTFSVDEPLTGCFDCAELFYRQSKDGGQTWSTLVAISNSPMADDKPQIVIDQDDHIYVFWEIGQDALDNRGDLTATAMASSIDGITWSQPTNFIFPGDISQRITAEIDALGHVVVVWGLAKGPGTYFQISTDEGLSWSVPQVIPGVFSRIVGDVELDNYHMARDSADNLHLVLTGTDPNDARHHYVFHLQWDGKAWSTPEIIFDSMGDLPEWPRIAIANGNQLHIVWFTRNEANIWRPGDKGADYRIWYTHSQALAPAETPVEIQPTATPLPTATSLPTATPIPTPTVEPAVLQAAVPDRLTGSLYTDYDEIFVIVQSLLPAVFIIGLVIIIVRMWRR